MGEKDKERRWREAIRHRQDRVAHDVRFVPFCVEVGGAWGSKAKTFFQTCVALAGDDRDIDLYHWSSERFSAAWKTTISVLVAKGRARVGVAASAADWPKRDEPQPGRLPGGRGPIVKVTLRVGSGCSGSWEIVTTGIRPYRAYYARPSLSIMPGRTWRDNGHKALCPRVVSTQYILLACTAVQRH